MIQIFSVTFNFSMQSQLAMGNLVSNSVGFVGDILSGNNRAYNLTTLGVNIVEGLLTDGGLMAAKAGFIASKVGIFGIKTVTALKASSVGKSVALGGMFGRTVELPKSQAMRQRILVNIAASKNSRYSSNFAILVAKEDQIRAGYKVDQWVMETVRKGEIVYGGLPGQSNYYTSLDVIQAANGDKNILGQLLQVKPHNKFGYRPNIGAYELKKDIRIPVSTTNANPHLGTGNSTQYFINKNLNLLELKQEYNLEKFYELNMPRNQLRY